MLSAGHHDTFLKLNLAGIGMLRRRRSLGACLFLLLLLQLPFQSTLGQGSVDIMGDWIVTGEETISSRTQFWNGNITVKAGGVLTITGAVLFFNSTSNRSHQGIVVEKGGSIRMQNVRLTTVNKSHGLTFLANGSVEMRDCRVEGIFTKRTLTGSWTAGFRVLSDNPIIEGTTFSRGLNFGPRFEGCQNVLFKGNTVTTSSTGLQLEGCSGKVLENVFYNNTDRQVVIRGCEGVEFRNNTVDMSGMGGLIVSGSKDVETSGNTYQGDFYVVYVSNHSRVTMMGETISGSQVHLEARDGSRVTLLDSRIRLNQTRVVDESTIESSRTVKVRVISGEEPVSGAIVRVKDHEKLLVAEGTTDDDGMAEFVLLEGTIKTSGTGQSVQTLAEPYRFQAVKGLYSASGSADISANPLIEMKMSLPWAFIIVGVLVVAAIVLVAFSPPGGGKRSKKGKKGKT